MLKWGYGDGSVMSKVLAAYAQLPEFGLPASIPRAGMAAQAVEERQGNP